MDEELRSRLARWFSVVELAEADTAAAVVACVREVVELLDTVEPTRVDRRRSTIRQTGHGWTVPGAIDIHLAHETDEDADLHIVVGDSEAIVSWLSAHEHVYPEDGEERRPWSAVVVDVVAAAMRGEYEVENHYRGKRLVKTRVVDVAEPEGHRVVGTAGSLLALLPWFGKKRVEVQRLDYGAQSPGPRSGA